MIVRNFYTDLKDASFKPITYGIYNKLDDDGVVLYYQNVFKEVFSIDDFEQYEFVLTDKEQFLVKMYNKDFLRNVKRLEKELESIVGAKVYIDHERGIIRLVKLKNINF